MSQTKAIYGYLKKNKSGITSLEALQRFGCMRLAARIRDIRDELPATEFIITEAETTNGKTYARYLLINS